MTFGQAIEELKAGKLVTRAGWNGRRMFLFMRPADELDIDFIIEKVKSLPQSVKDYYGEIKRTTGGVILTTFPAQQQKLTVQFTAYLCMKAADGTIVNGWLASQTDMLSDDWELFEL